MVPAVIVPGGLNRFVFGKLLIAAVGLVLAFVASARGTLPRTIRWMMLAGSATLLISALLSDSPQSAIFGRADRYEGVFVLATYVLAASAGARLLGPDKPVSATRIALNAMAVCALLIGAFAVLEAFGLRPLSTDLDRPGSLLGNASDEGAFAALYAGPLLVAALRRRQPLLIAGAGAAVVTVVLSASRGALVGFAVVLVAIGLASSRRSRLPTLAVLAGTAALALIVPFTRDRLLGASPLSGATISGRSLLWRETLSLLAGHWPFGVGPSGFENAIVGEHDLRWQRTVGPANPPGSPHNWILQVLCAGGVVLLLIVAVLVVLTTRSALRLVRQEGDGWHLGIAAGLVGYGAALLFHLSSPGTTLPACVLAGSVLAVRPVAAHTRAPGRQALQIGAVVSSAALAVIFLLASAAEVELRAAVTAAARGDLAGADADFRAARALRIWDVDLPAKALHEFAVRAQAGDKAAVSYGSRWSARVRPVADDEQVAQNRATILDAAGNHAAAAAVLDGLLRRDPYNPMVLVFRGVVHAEMHDYQGALRALRRATDVEPDNALAWQDLAFVHAALGQPQQADAARAKARQLHDTTPD